jgi:hypothetical protein
MEANSLMRSKIIELEEDFISMKNQEIEKTDSKLKTLAQDSREMASFLSKVNKNYPNNEEPTPSTTNQIRTPQEDFSQFSSHNVMPRLPQRDSLYEYNHTSQPAIDESKMANATRWLMPCNDQSTVMQRITMPARDSTPGLTKQGMITPPFDSPNLQNMQMSQFHNWQNQQNGPMQMNMSYAPQRKLFNEQEYGQPGMNMHNSYMPHSQYNTLHQE